MYWSKLHKNKQNFLILLTLLGFSCCKMETNYSLTKIGSDQILNGSVQKEVLMDAKLFPWFNYEYRIYKPDTSILTNLKLKSKNIHALVFAGSWCSDTQRELPRFYKIMDLAGIEAKQMDCIMLDQNKKCAYMNVESIQISHIPTFIFYKDGKECGRIIEKADSSIELSIQSFYK